MDSQEISKVKGRLIIAGDKAVFGSVGEKLFGMQIEEILASFNGELGNMIAGGMDFYLLLN